MSNIISMKAWNKSMIYFRTEQLKTQGALENENKPQSLPCGEYILNWMGTFDMALVFPVMRSVSSAISFLTAAAIIRRI
jgi:hypothetical protein